MTNTRYIVSTNGVDLSTTYASKGKALETANAYVYGAERMTRDETEHTHVITVRTERTGKIVFDQSVTVPALPAPAPQAPVQAPSAYRASTITAAPSGTLCGFTFSNGGRPSCKGTDGAPSAAVHTLLRDLPVAKAGTPLCGYHSPFDVQVSDSLDSATTHTGNSLCSYCEASAEFTVTLPSEGQTDYACGVHFAEHYPYLNNSQRRSALCPDVTKGCSHSMAMSEFGYGTACVEYADAQGIEWHLPAKGVSLAKEYGLPYPYAGSDLSAETLRQYPGHTGGLFANDPISLASLLRITTT